MNPTRSGTPVRAGTAGDGATVCRPRRPRARRLEVFSVDTTSVQVTWAALGPGPVCIRAGDTALDLLADGGPGAAIVDGLPPGHEIEVSVDGEGVGGWRRLRATTLRPPPGEALTRFATISDLHVGEQGFGYLGRIREPGDPEPYTVRSAEAAVAESSQWGAELLVVKGDVTDRGRRSEWAAAGGVLGHSPMPVIAVPGNHDVKAGYHLDPGHALAEQGVEVTRGVAVRDLPGLRLVLVDSTIDELHRGRVRDVATELVDALRDAAATGRGAVVALHHQVHPSRAVHWPPGLSAAEARQLLTWVAQANPHTLITSGHIHRHRRNSWGPVTTTTVGSVKDYPGVWAGYVVHEGGLRQVVRRVARPDVIRWTERSGRTMGGAYRWWTPGRIESRCFSLDWTASPS